MEHYDNNHKAWAQGKKPSMKRRMDDFDYLDRGIYMITMVIEGRRPVLGTLAGHAEATEGPEVPHVELSPLGKRVKEEWEKISHYFPQIEMMKLCIMPDHIHGVLFVHERIDRHLGHVLNGFKTGTRKAARELGVIAEAQPQLTGTKAKGEAVPSAETVPQPQPRLQPPSSAKHPPIGTLWEPGYNDRLLLRKSQLARMLAYLADNPRRLLLKRQYPQYLSHITTIHIAGIEMQAMGNTTLLQSLTKLQVQCSRHMYPWEIQKRKEQFLTAGHKGAIIVSPCISPGEVEITTACMEAGIPLIVLLLKGFPPFFKPKPKYLTACAQGRLLLLSPFPWQNEKLIDMRKRCLELNYLAKTISETK